MITKGDTVDWAASGFYLNDIYVLCRYLKEKYPQSSEDLRKITILENTLEKALSGL
jgi:hypothetical protein